MFLLELISAPLPSLTAGETLQNYFKHAGLWGAFPLGILFALSFCPVSAALFFGSLIPMSVKFSSPLIFSSMYGIGTGIPVFIFSILIASGVKWMSRAFNQVQIIEYWVRMISGIVMIFVLLILAL
jgi:cytochrome c biogenesis protein CcdA